MEAESQNQPPSAFPAILQVPSETPVIHDIDGDDDDDLLANSGLDLNIPGDEEIAESVNLDMLEAHSFITEKQKGAKFIPCSSPLFTIVDIDFFTRKTTTRKFQYAKFCWFNNS